MPRSLPFPPSPLLESSFPFPHSREKERRDAVITGVPFPLLLPVRLFFFSFSFPVVPARTGKLGGNKMTRRAKGGGHFLYSTPLPPPGLLFFFLLSPHLHR